MGVDRLYDLQTFDHPGMATSSRSGTSTSIRRSAFASPQVLYPGSIDRVDFSAPPNRGQGWVCIEIPRKGQGRVGVFEKSRLGIS